MNRTDRLMGIMLELQATGGCRAEDLAATFETSLRTIYRDITALCEAGVPIVALPGQGYALPDGYFLPPVAFTPEEATTLLLGAEFVERRFDARYREATKNAAKKLEAVMNEKLRAQVTRLRSAMRFLGGDEVDDERLSLLRTAVLEQRQVELQYFARTSLGANNQTRRFDPYGLANFGYRWYAVGFDHRSGERRLFRLDRMENVRLLEERFTRPADFVFAPPRDDEAQRSVEVRLLFRREVARFAKENAWFCDQTHEREDGVEFVCRVRDESELLPFILSWGASVTVLEPSSLREAVLAEVKGMLQNAREGDALLT